jgi:hypothetical protein
MNGNLLFVAGILFILATKQVLGGSEEEEEIGPDTLNVGWEKMMLIMFVMTLHSLTEGVGKFFCACLLRNPRLCLGLCSKYDRTVATSLLQRAPSEILSYLPLSKFKLNAPTCNAQASACPSAAARACRRGSSSRCPWPCTTSRRAWRWA